MKQITPLTSTSDTMMVEMTIEEYMRFVQAPKQKNIKKGLAGIREVFQCSPAQAFKIAHSEWFKPSIVKMGRLLLFDADLAWELAHKNSTTL